MDRIKHFKKAGRGHVWSRPDSEDRVICESCGTPGRYNWGNILEEVAYNNCTVSCFKAYPCEKVQKTEDELKDMLNDVHQEFNQELNELNITRHQFLHVYDIYELMNCLGAENAVLESAEAKKEKPYEGHEEDYRKRRH